jgi:hypothetical protein
MIVRCTRKLLSLLDRRIDVRADDPPVTALCAPEEHQQPALWQLWWQFSSVHARPDMSTRVSHKPVTCRSAIRWTVVDHLSAICSPAGRWHW